MGGGEARKGSAHRFAGLPPPLPYLWAPGSAGIDQHVAFRLTFSTASASATALVHHTGVSWYNLFVDGRQVAEGPTRFIGEQPFYATTSVLLPTAGKHVITLHAHSVGTTTRLLLSNPPFVGCAVEVAEAGSQLRDPAPVWRCRVLPHYKAQWRRLSTLLGWVENCAVESDLLDMALVSFDDSAWQTPVAAATGTLKPAVPLSPVVGPATSVPGPLAELGHGTLCEQFGYQDDDPPARFFLRRLTTAAPARADEGQAAVGQGPGAGPDLAAPDYGPPQGLWWRYDAARCQLLRPQITISAPAGAVVEVCYSQSLIGGKGSPYHPLCGSETCYMDRYTLGSSVAGKTITLCPVEPRGCRYVEVHVVCDDAVGDLKNVTVTGVTALYRCYSAYHAEPEGTFTTSDAQLKQIWKTGVDTTRSCVEDSPIDGPCRERGQWTGDTLAVTLPNLIFTYGDVSPVRLTLLQSAQSADKNGVISGNCPEVTYPVDYALIWFEGAQRYHRATGDTSLLSQLFPAAVKCMDFFLSPACRGGQGFDPKGYHSVIDWGYTPSPAFPVDLCLNAMLISALDALVSWCNALDNATAAAKYQAALASQLKVVRGYLTGADTDPAVAGFHACALAIRAGVFGDASGTAALQTYCDFVQSHLS